MIRVRPAEPQDAAGWLELRTALWPEEPDDHPGEIEAYFAGRAGEPQEVLVAEDAAGRLVGLAELSIRPYAEGCHSSRVAYLEGWYVVPHQRRRGVGRALISAFEAWGRSQGCREIASDAQVDNETSLQAHLGVGFEDVGLVRCFRKAIR